MFIFLDIWHTCLLQQHSGHKQNHMKIVFLKKWNTLMNSLWNWATKIFISLWKFCCSVRNLLLSVYLLHHFCIMLVSYLFEALTSNVMVLRNWIALCISVKGNIIPNHEAHPYICLIKKFWMQWEMYVLSIYIRTSHQFTQK